MFTKIRDVKDECPLCEGVRPLVYGSRTETIRVRGEEIEVDVKLFYCPTEDHYFQNLDDDEERIQKAYRGYRIRKGYLQPEEIRYIREQYGLSQRAFAEFLGWGVMTIQRAESGALLDSGYNALLVFLQKTDNFEQYFESRRPFLSEKITGKIEQKLKEMDIRRKQMFLDLVFKHIKTDLVKVVPAENGMKENNVVGINFNRATFSYGRPFIQNMGIISSYKNITIDKFIKRDLNRKIKDEGGLAIAA